MHATERAEAAKSLVLHFSWLPAIAVAAPLVNAFVRSDMVWASLAILLGPTFLWVRGVRTLLYPAENAARPHAIAYGAASASGFLLLAPVSLCVAIENIATRPSWMALSLTGTVANVVYLWFAYRHWGSHRAAT
jgi:hypothetical protein